MIGRLGTKLYLAQTFVSASGSFFDSLCEQFRIHKMRTGASGKKTSVSHKSEAAHVNLAVSFDRIFHGISGFGESGRVQNDDIIRLLCTFECRKQIKDVGSLKLYDRFKMVKGRIFLRLPDGRFRGIDTKHGGGAGHCRIEGKGAGMRKAVQYFFVFTYLMDGGPVIFLIEEKSGLLPVFYVDKVFDSILRDLHVRIKRRADKTFAARHSLLFSHFRIASLVNTAYRDAVIV